MRYANIGGINSLDYAATESLNVICANLSFVGRNLKRIVVTSCEAGAGKTKLTMHIAQNLANRGKRVLVMDVDLRKSVMMKRFSIEIEGEAVGLAHYLAGYNSIDDVTYQTNVEGLHLMPIGHHVVNPIPLLNSPEFSDLLDELAAKYDLIFLDSPPIGLVIDAAEIAQYCDGSMLIVNYGQTRRRELMEAQKQMMQSGCPVIGCVLNKVALDTISTKKYYGQRYSASYAAADNKSRSRKKSNAGR